MTLTTTICVSIMVVSGLYLLGLGFSKMITERVIQAMHNAK